MANKLAAYDGKGAADEHPKDNPYAHKKMHDGQVELDDNDPGRRVKQDLPF